MTNRPSGSISVSTTDVLIAMLTSDLRGSWAEGSAIQRREHVDPAGSGTLPAAGDAEDVGDAGDAGVPGVLGVPGVPAAPGVPADSARWQAGGRTD